jgi:hypothetical protein
VDLQLLESREPLDLTQIRATCVRLFEYRRQQSWPPLVVADADWATLYAAAAEDLHVLPTASEAVAWTNALIKRIDGARS